MGPKACPKRTAVSNIAARIAAPQARGVRASLNLALAPAAFEAAVYKRNLQAGSALRLGY